MAHDVFISYVVSDRKAADAVCAILEKNKVRCWIAPRDVLPGTTWAKAIIEAISDSRLMVLILSSRSNDSPHVMSEVECAVHRGIPILPLLIEDMIPSGDMEFFLSTMHWLDAMSPPLEAHLERLADAVKNLLSATVSNIQAAETQSNEPVEPLRQSQIKTTPPSTVDSAHTARLPADRCKSSDPEGQKPMEEVSGQIGDTGASQAKTSASSRVSLIFDQWLDSADQDTRLQAIQEIKKRSLTQKTDRLVKLVKQDLNWRVRDAALHVLLEFRKKMPEVSGSWFPHLLRIVPESFLALSNPYWGNMYSFCQTAWPYVADSEGGIEWLANLVRSHKDTQVRLLALQVLAEFRPKKSEAFGAWYTDLLGIAVTISNGTSSSILRELALKELEELG